MNEYIWTPAGTDITERWRAMGWVPPSQSSAVQEKWNRYKELPMRRLSDEERFRMAGIMTNVVPFGGHK